MKAALKKNGEESTMDRFEHEFNEKLDRIIACDDSEALVDLFNKFPGDSPLALYPIAVNKAKRCMTALATGQALIPPYALDGCATLIHLAASCFPDLDIINIMLMRGGYMDLHINIPMFTTEGIPLQHVLDSLSTILPSWSTGDSIFKLIILLCQWEIKHRLDGARLIATATHPHLVRDLAWTFRQDGKLMQLAALLLVARDAVMLPYATGITIQQDTKDLCSKPYVDHEQARYKSLLVDVCKLFDVFEKAGDALSFYCKSMCKPVPIKKVLVDIVGLLQKAGFVLQVEDFDLRDCYRGCHELWKPSLYKLSDPPRQKNNYNFSLYPTETLGSGSALCKLPPRHWDPLIGRFKLGQVIPLAPSLPRARMLSTLAERVDHTSVSSVAVLKPFADAAMKLKRGFIRCL